MRLLKKLKDYKVVSLLGIATLVGVAWGNIIVAGVSSVLLFAHFSNCLYQRKISSRLKQRFTNNIVLAKLNNINYCDYDASVNKMNTDSEISDYNSSPLGEKIKLLNNQVYRLNIRLLKVNSRLDRNSHYSFGSIKAKTFGVGSSVVLPKNHRILLKQKKASVSS